MSLAYKLISLWFLVSSPVVLWDAIYCFMRPDSMKGGRLHWVWEPYGLYQEIDDIYGIKALQNNDGYPNAQALINLIEIVLNVVYVYLADVVGSPDAPVIGFASIVMTLGKTLLYLTHEYYCNFCNTGHNGWYTWLLLYLLPNGIWVIFPALVAFKLGSDMAANLRAHAYTKKKNRNGTKSGLSK